MVRNIDPFERQRRQMNSNAASTARSAAIPFDGAARLSSNREDRAIRDQMHKSQQSPGAHIEQSQQMTRDALRPQGSAFRQQFRSQWGTKKGLDQMAQGAETSSPRFSNKSTRYLRSLDFSFIRSKFNVMRGNSSLQRRTNLLLFMLPVTVSIGVGATHMLSQSFMIYLKYQALIDAYYYQEVMKQPELVQQIAVVAVAEEKESEVQEKNQTTETQSA